MRRGNKSDKIFSELDLDILKELANIGLGNSSTVLCKLLNKDIKVKITNLSLIEKGELTSHIGGDQEIIAVIIRFEGDIRGCAINVLNEENSLKIVESLNNFKENTLKKLDNYGVDTLKECSNIIIGSYLTSLSKMTDLKIKLGLPKFERRNSRVIYKEVISKNIEGLSSQIFNVHNVLYSEDFEIPVYSDLILAYDQDSINKILKSSKEKNL